MNVLFMNVDDDFANQSGSSTHSHSNPLRLRVPAAGGWLLPHGEAGIAPSWQPWRPQDVVWGTTNPIGWCGTQNKADYVNHGFVGVDVFLLLFFVPRCRNLIWFGAHWKLDDVLKRQRSVCTGLFIPPRYHHSARPNMCRGWWLLYITSRSLGYNVNVTSLVCHNFHGVMGGCRATGMQTKDFKELKSNYAANLRCKQRWVQCILWLKFRLYAGSCGISICPVLAEERAMRQVSPQSVSNSLWALARQDLGMPGPTFFPTWIIIPNGSTASYAKYRPTFHNGYVRPVRHSRVHPSSPAMFIGLLLNEWGRVVGGDPNLQQPWRW